MAAKGFGWNCYPIMDGLRRFLIANSVRLVAHTTAVVSFIERSVTLRDGLRRKERDFFFAYPALIPHPGSPGLGNVTGLLPAVPGAGLENVGLKFVHTQTEKRAFPLCFSARHRGE